METQSELLRLLNEFNRNGVRYMIVGGFAVNHYGYSRTTFDVDMYLEDTITNRKKLIDALDQLGYGRMDMLLNAPILPGYCEIIMDDEMYLDLMTDIMGLNSKDYESQYARRTTAVIQGIEVHYISYQDLLENKKETGRMKDIDDYENLKEG
jgi:predicted nucleotidyltransferase